MRHTTHLANLTRGFLGVVAAFSWIVVGCSNATAPDEEFRALTGTYAATILFTNGSNAAVSGLQCAGRFIIAEQNGNAITGSIQKNRPCNVSLNFEGNVTSGGGLTVNVQNEAAVTPFSSDCTFSDAGTYNGSVIDGELVLSRPYAFTCSRSPSGTGSEVIGASR